MLLLEDELLSDAEDEELLSSGSSLTDSSEEELSGKRGVISILSGEEFSKPSPRTASFSIISGSSEAAQPEDKIIITASKNPRTLFKKSSLLPIILLQYKKSGVL